VQPNFCGFEERELEGLIPVCCGEEPVSGAMGFKVFCPDPSAFFLGVSALGPFPQ